MKNFSLIFFIVLSALLLNGTNDCNGQWIKCDSIQTGIVFSMIGIENNIFAGSYYGVYISSNNGTNWTQTSLNNKIVGSFATIGNNIFAGTLNNGIFLSTNGGTNWSQTSFNNKTAVTLMTIGNTIYTGTDYFGVYFSTNNGTYWTQAGLDTESVYSLASLGSHIFAGTDNNGVYSSTNNGTNWIHTALNNKTVFSLGLLGNNIFAGTDSGIYLSTNNGVSWSQTAMNNKAVWTFAINGNNIFAGTENQGVYLSQNNGASWINKNQGFNINPSINKLLIANNYIFAGTWGNSIWRRSYQEIIDVKKTSTEVPSRFLLNQNYPNPFNPTTTIRFETPLNPPFGKGGTGSETRRGDGMVTLKVFDILGREIATLVNEKLSAGTYEVKFEGTNLPSGVYYYKLSIDNEPYSVKKMVLLK